MKDNDPKRVSPEFKLELLAAMGIPEDFHMAMGRRRPTL